MAQREIPAGCQSIASRHIARPIRGMGVLLRVLVLVPTHICQIGEIYEPKWHNNDKFVLVFDLSWHLISFFLSLGLAKYL